MTSAANTYTEPESTHGFQAGRTGGSRVVAAMLMTVLATAIVPATTIAQESGSVQVADEATVRRAEARAIESRAFFRQGLYKEAARGFMEAYALVKRPPLVYAAARAWEKAGDLRRAHAMFSLYLDQPKIPDENKAFAQSKVKKLAVLLKDAENQPSEASGGGMPIWSTVAGGVLAVGAGASWWFARSIAADLGPDSLGTTVKDQADADAHKESAASARVWQKVAIGSAVVGAGLLGWSAWRAMSGNEPSKAAKVQLAPMWTGTGAGWALSGRF